MRLLSAFLFALLVAAEALAQGGATITGRVTDETGGALPGVTIDPASTAAKAKANQYYRRGFNLDHGSDFATTLAGIPINLPSSAHFHGYSDTNLLIPALVSGVQYKKGPYFAEDGDFSAAGSANINYVNALDSPLVAISAGSHGWGRVLAAASPSFGRGVALVGLELARNDGPCDRPDDLKKINGILRYTRGDTRNGLSITGMGYSANWDATDQVLRVICEGHTTRVHGRSRPLHQLRSQPSQLNDGFTECYHARP
jgi:hypothetical protein